mmetsp:Transcript_5560/g.20120  ORF Transcript_5560/g.20120 Transcript_5560/m.20120 type:complete len:204 (+) Transcript_5560:1344-1955(+)
MGAPLGRFRQQRPRPFGHVETDPVRRGVPRQAHRHHGLVRVWLSSCVRRFGARPRPLGPGHCRHVPRHGLDQWTARHRHPHCSRAHPPQHVVHRHRATGSPPPTRRRRGPPARANQPPPRDLARRRTASPHRRRTNGRARALRGRTRAARRRRRAAELGASSDGSWPRRHRAPQAPRVRIRATAPARTAACPWIRLARRTLLY